MGKKLLKGLGWLEHVYIIQTRSYLHGNRPLVPVLLLFFTGAAAVSGELEAVVRLSLSLLVPFLSPGGVRVVLIGAMTGGRGTGEDSSVGELGKSLSMVLIWVRGPGVGDGEPEIESLSVSSTSWEVVHKVCSGAGGRGGGEWTVPLPDATGAF